MRHSASVLTFLSGATLVLAGTAVAQVSSEFPDVTRGAFYAPAVGRMVARGIVRGYENGRFGPEDPVSRGQAAVLIERYDAEVVESLRLQIEELRAELDLGACGDGDVQTGEECDDGNRSDDDGCSTWCQDEESVRSPASPTPSGCPAGVAIGEGFPSPDGCNTCTCTQHGVACTERACAPQSPTPPTSGDRCLSDQDCGENGVCSTSYGDCQSACEPGAEVCIQACAGFCSPATRPCRPYVCADGTVYPACNPSGYTINYFSDPCLGSNPRCGDGVCETLEAEACDAGQAGCFACAFDCGSSELSCHEQIGQFEKVVSASGSCSMDKDCVVFEQSCPYVTCGVAIRAGSEGKVRDAANAQIETCQAAGEPMACAMCLGQRAICERGQCALKPTNTSGNDDLQRRCATYIRDGRNQEHCGVCGDGICSTYEQCTPSSCSGNNCTRDCGGLHCPKDCS